MHASNTLIPYFCPEKNKSVDMRNLLYIFLLAATMAVAGCASRGADDAVLSDSEYTEATAMSVHLAEPERALTIIDSAVIVGNLSRPRAEYLKAVTQYGGLDNMPLARQTCLDLLEHKEILTDTLTLEQTYILLASIEKSSCNYAAVIRYATEASRLAHASGRYHVVGKMEGYIAHAQALTGHTNEGIDRLQGVIGELRQMNTFEGVTSYHSVSKNLIHILNDNGRFPEMVSVCEAMLGCYDELEQHPERFSIEREGFDPAEFVDFARGQTLAFLTIAYAEQGNIAKGLEAEEAVFRTRWSQSPDCDLMLVSAYHRLGQFDRFDQAMDRIDAEMIARGDTLNANYYTGLQLRSNAAEMRGCYADALHYANRASVIHDSLEYYNQREQLNELATVYHLQEERLARQQKESEARIYRIVAVGTMLLLLLTAFILWRVHRDNRLLTEKNRRLFQLYNEQEEHEEQGEKDTAGAEADTQHPTFNAQLYNRLCALMEDPAVFTDPDANHETLARLVGTNYKYVYDALHECAGTTPAEFINHYRIRHAAMLLTTTDQPVGLIAEECGIASRPTFNRLFREHYSMTPTEYRNAANQTSVIV